MDVALAKVLRRHRRPPREAIATRLWPISARAETFARTWRRTDGPAQLARTDARPGPDGRPRAGPPRSPRRRSRAARGRPDLLPRRLQVRPLGRRPRPRRPPPPSRPGWPAITPTGPRRPALALKHGWRSARGGRDRPGPLDPIRVDPGFVSLLEELRKAGP